MNNEPRKTVAFIGLGVMGREMAGHLLKAGYTVNVYDVVSEACDALIKSGATSSLNVADAIRDADIVVSMLPNTPHVETVVYAADGIRENPPKGKLYVDMSTISPEATRKMALDLASVGVAMLDAPVSGGPIGAKNAALSIMVGGDMEAFERAKPFLEAMGTTISRVGDSGAGQTVKLCNQLVCAVNIQAVCEALALGRASGVDLEQLRDVLLGGSASSWMLEKLGPAMISGDASAGFRIDLSDPAFLYKVGIIRKHCLSICCNEQVTISQNKIII